MYFIIVYFLEIQSNNGLKFGECKIESYARSWDENIIEGPILQMVCPSGPYSVGMQLQLLIGHHCPQYCIKTQMVENEVNLNILNYY